MGQLGFYSSLRPICPYVRKTDTVMRLQDQVSRRLMIVPNKLSRESGRIKDRQSESGEIYLRAVPSRSFRSQVPSLVIAQSSSILALLLKDEETNICIFADHLNLCSFIHSYYPLRLL